MQLELFGDFESKIDKAIKFLKYMEPEKGYKLGFSGGKDSQVVYWLMKEAKVKFDSFYRWTTVDPPQLKYFIQKEYPEVIIQNPKTSMWDLIVKKGIPPTRKIRYCCEHLKETGWELNDAVVTGVRKEESPKRKLWRQIQHCSIGSRHSIINPILDFTEAEVWELIKNVAKIPYCRLYDEGFTRLGCIGCPMANWKQREFEFRVFPKHKDAYVRSFSRMLEERRVRGMKELWRNKDEVWSWWLYGADNKINTDEVQLRLW